MINLDDIQDKIDQLIDHEEFEQSFVYARKIRKLHPGISKLDYLFYRTAIEKYKNQNNKFITIKIFILSIYFLLISFFISKKNKFKQIEFIWIKAPLKKNIIKKFITKCVRFKKYNHAINALELSSEYFKSDLWILKTLAYLYKLKYDPENELRIRKKIILLNTDVSNEEKKITELENLIKTEEEKKITPESILEDIRKDPDNADLHMKLINKYVNVRNFITAIDYLENYLNSLDIDNYRLRKKLFLIKEQNLNLQLAKAEDDKNLDEINKFNNLINELKISKLSYFSSQNPHDKQLKFELAKQLLDQKKYDQAINEFEAIKDFHQRQTAILIYLSDAYSRINNEIKAIEFLKKANKNENSSRESFEIKTRMDKLINKTNSQ